MSGDSRQSPPSGATRSGPGHSIGSTLDAGTVIGERYRVEKLLGQGGMRRFAAWVAAAIAGGAAAPGCGDDRAPVPVAETDLAPRPPSAVSGGTLIALRDGVTAVMSDPDRDRVWIVDVPSRALRSEVALQQGDEPGRVVEDGAGLVHVSLRRGGALAVVHPGEGALLDRKQVCGAPRGLAYDAAANALHVACASGELVTLDASTHDVRRTLHLGHDLRDVVLDAGRLLVSRFRSAEILEVVEPGQIASRTALPVFSAADRSTWRPSVAYRMVALPDGGVAVVHQRALDGAVSIVQAGYSSAAGCDRWIVHATVSFVRDREAGPPLLETHAAPTLWSTALPVDVAISPDGALVAVVASGSRSVWTVARSSLDLGFAASRGGGIPNAPVGCGPGEYDRTLVEGHPIAATFSGDLLLVQTRAPASLVVLGASEGHWFQLATIGLPVASTDYTGHDVFHRAPDDGGLACASCHPEGREDGRTWMFQGLGPRRTQSLEGGVRATAPFHWSGDLPDMDALLGEVLATRMDGGALPLGAAGALGAWLDSLPLPPRPPALDGAATARGAALFADPAVACASCHAGDRLTNNESMDVGTGGRFQVPTLRGLAERAPFMHDGCAPTLLDRFTDPQCGGGDAHGKTSHLTPAQTYDLVRYLETL